VLYDYKFSVHARLKKVLFEYEGGILFINGCNGDITDFIKALRCIGMERNFS